MRSRIILTFAVVVAVAAAVSAADDAKKCTTPPDECARQIRSMLNCRLYLGVLVEEANGLVVKSVVPDSPAEHADMKAGDRLIAVNGHRTGEATIKDFKQILDEVGKTHRHLWMLVRRQGALKKIDVMMEPYSKAQIERIVAQHLAEAHAMTSAVPDSRP